MKTKPKPFDEVGAIIAYEYLFQHLDEIGAIIAYESGELDQEGIINLFQHLIDNGHAWVLPGSYGRTARALIDAGECHE